MKVKDLTLVFQHMIEVILHEVFCKYISFFLLSDGKATSRGCSTINNICEKPSTNAAKPLCKCRSRINVVCTKFIDMKQFIFRVKL